MKSEARGAMPPSQWSAKDLINKWRRKLPNDTAGSLPWVVLDQLVFRLSDDTKLPRDKLKDVILRRDVSGLFSIATAFDVTEYTSPDLLLQDRLVIDIFSKFDFENSPFNKREKAQLRFFEAEELCREANSRIKNDQGTADHEINSVIQRAIRIIDEILGEFDVNEMLTFSRFGPGASLCVSGPFTTEYFKLCNDSPTVTPDAAPYARALMRFDPLWGSYLLGMNPNETVGYFSPLKNVTDNLKISSNNKVTFVPKNAKTERSIAIEPYFNIFFQLGIGGMIRKRLNVSGINLDSQKQNQLKALEGSLTGLLSTIDFSMASDTIGIECVRLLIRPDWFYHMDALRSKTYKMTGRDSFRPFNKFSTMGNGYTFELETLIFYAIARASGDHLSIGYQDLTVFGDDVVLDSRVVALFTKVTSYLGFRINEDKSFSTGRFRESCGCDFLNGISVRPVFCKELGTTQHIASLANRLSELNRSVGSGSRINDMLDHVVAFLHSRIPRDVARLVVGPPSEDVDGYIHTTCPQRLAASELVKWNRRLYAWEHPTIRFTATKFERRNAAITLLANRSLAVRPKAIYSRQDDLCYALRKLSLRNPFRYRDKDGNLMHRQAVNALTEFYSERTPIEITGREIGKLTLGTAIFWDLPR